MITLFKGKHKTTSEMIVELSTELKRIHGLIEPELRKKQHPLDTTYAVKNLQKELEADIKKFEVQLLERKVEVYRKVLNILKP